MKKFVWLLLIFVTSLSTVLMAEPAAYSDKQRMQFLSAYQDIKKGKKPKISHFRDYPLYPYLEYEKLRRNLKGAPEKQLLDFIEQYKNTPLADKIWSYWLGRLATKHRWEKIISVYSPMAADTSAQCHFLEALFHVGNKDSALEDAKQFWMSAKSRPKSCNAIFKQLRKSKKLHKDDYWQRIELAINKGNSRLARSLVKYLPDDEKKIAEQLIVARGSPKRAMKSSALGKGKYSRKVIAYAIKRIARKNYKKGYKLWREVSKKYPFTSEEKYKVEAYLASRAALNHDSAAIKSFNKIPAKYRDDEANIWMARIALREGKWRDLNNAIDAMSEELSQRDIWRYWKARASSQEGDRQQAKEIFSDLAGNATFYGFLSADRLGEEYAVLDHYNEDWSDCEKNVQVVTPISRALEWFALGKDSLAYKEWFWGLKHMNKDGKLAAAALALKMERPILAVRTVAKTKDWNQVGLRFPLLYKKLITSMSNEHNVNPAWVYGIMRRESAFQKTAVSSARAVGLMQLMPATARHIGKKLGLGRVRKSDLLTPHINVKLGSAYLGSMLKDFNGSYVKATAGYNAGPNRSVKWTPEKTIDADRWVESIPFTETRKYVRAVMAYTTIYDHKLKKGKSRRISDWLHPVEAKKVN